MGGSFRYCTSRTAASDSRTRYAAGYGVPTAAAFIRIRARFACVLIEVYGSTEAVPQLQQYDDRRWAIGLPTAGFDVRIVDEDDNDVPQVAREVIIEASFRSPTMLDIGISQSAPKRHSVGCGTAPAISHTA